MSSFYRTRTSKPLQQPPSLQEARSFHLPQELKDFKDPKPTEASTKLPTIPLEKSKLLFQVLKTPVDFTPFMEHAIKQRS